MWRTICAGFVVTVCLLNGCNKDSDTASTAPPPVPALPDTVKPRPTADQLQQRVKLDLKYDPISMMVPPTWELKSLNDGAVVVLEGDTPTDTVGISIPPARSIIGETNVPAAVKVKELEAEARADAAKFPGLIQGDPVRDIPNAHLIEQISLRPSDATTNPAAADPSQIVQWIITVCVPSDNGFKAYELRFTGLTLKTYNADRQFLRDIIGSISYTPPTDQSPN